jgi:cytosine/adenosine deaminase-related metal-dependent hydrolase
MFTVARMALASQRALDNAAERARSGGIPATSTVPAAEAFDWITTRGAAMLGMADRIGSLAPGKQADVAVMSLGPLAMWPVHDPVATVVMQGSGARMRDVLVAGRFAKRNGRLAWPDLISLRARLAASGERILSKLHVKSVSREIAAT